MCRQLRPKCVLHDAWILACISCRLRPCMLILQVLNPPRPGKKLAVLDIDYTIFDLNSSAERPEELARPFLHEFFSAVCEREG